MRLITIGRLTISLTRVMHRGHVLKGGCGCKMLLLGPLWIDWEYKDGCGNVPYEGDDE